VNKTTILAAIGVGVAITSLAELLNMRLRDLAPVLCSTILVIGISNSQLSYADTNSVTPKLGVIGSMTERACNTVHGSIETLWYYSADFESIKVCKLGENKYYELSNQPNPVLGPYGGIPEGRRATDPDTGVSYFFFYPDIPNGCEASHNWGGGWPAILHQLTVKAGSEYFTIGVGSSNSICTFKEFIPETNRLRFDSIAAFNETSSFEVAIPEKLLSGPYRVLVDDREISVDSVDNKSGYAIVRFHFDVTNQYQRNFVQVVGSEAIPEFPMSSLLGIMIAMSMTVLFLNYRRLSKLRVRN